MNWPSPRTAARRRSWRGSIASICLGSNRWFRYRVQAFMTQSERGLRHKLETARTASRKEPARCGAWTTDNDDIFRGLLRKSYAFDLPTYIPQQCRIYAGVRCVTSDNRRASSTRGTHPKSLCLPYMM